MVFVCIFFCFLRFSLFYQINRVSKTKKVLCVGEVQLYNVDFERQKIIFGEKKFGCELEQFVQVSYKHIQVV